MDLEGLDDEFESFDLDLVSVMDWVGDVLVR